MLPAARCLHGREWVWIERLFDWSRHAMCMSELMCRTTRLFRHL
jgi:hypothetical protein